MDYSTTVNLPTTDFPMKANLPAREPDMLKNWEAADLYRAILDARTGKETYILHDGPPYANGNIHLGHALNKILKDIIVKHKSMMGLRAPYVPGWDCHGLPIELQVTKQLGDKARTMPKVEIRKQCRQYADRFYKIQMEEFKRLGVFGDYEKPYLTMSNEYEASIVETFGNIFSEGFIYKSKKPIYWCPTCVTALAEAEIEYDDHTSPSVYVKFRVDPAGVSVDGIDRNNLFIVIWTTTPWTLPANLGVCFHPGFPYSAYRFGDEYYIIADGLIEQMTGATGLSYSAKIPVNRNQIEALTANHPFIDRKSRVIFGDFVTLEQGTGIVHIAPGHGAEDYSIGLQYGLDLLSPVDDYGRFTDEFEPMKGIKVFDANPKIIELMKEKNALIFSSQIAHSYAHCWRCKKPLISRATEQWFFKIDHNDMRKLAIAATDDTRWIPGWGKSRFLGMVTTRPDWCLSRQRTWGVPIPSFRCAACGKNGMNAASIRHFAGIARGRGIDSWYTDDIHTLIPEGTRCSCGSGEFEKEFDILDVWFDSGVSHFAVLDGWKDLHWPADLYLEGSDQHRGWFQSSLWPALALRRRAPYTTVLTHGFVLDDKGKAMSKSQGNVIPPADIIKKFGADILRLWVSSEDYRNDVRIGMDMINQMADSYRKIRNTFKFIIGNLEDFRHDDRIPYNELGDIDQWLLHKLYHLSQGVIEAYESFEFHQVFRRIINFCTVDLSGIYFDISKDILYIERKDSAKRRANQTVLYEIYHTMARLVAPVLVFTADEIWKFLHSDGSIHTLEYHRLDERFNNPAVEKRMESLVDIKKDTLKPLEVKRKEKLIGTSLEAELTIFVKDDSARAMLAAMTEEDRNRFFQVSRVIMPAIKPDGLEDHEHSFIAVEKSNGKKCVRCWNYFSAAAIGTDPEHPDICTRCTAIVRQL